MAWLAAEEAEKLFQLWNVHACCVQKVAREVLRVHAGIMCRHAESGFKLRPIRRYPDNEIRIFNIE